jgi:hypothetical protein
MLLHLPHELRVVELGGLNGGNRKDGIKAVQPRLLFLLLGFPTGDSLDVDQLGERVEPVAALTLPSETYGAPCPGGCLDGGAG